jgi:hypothetical protein
MNPTRRLIIQAAHTALDRLVGPCLYRRHITPRHHQRLQPYLFPKQNFAARAETGFSCSFLRARLLSGQADIHSYPGKLWLHTKIEARWGNEMKGTVQQEVDQGCKGIVRWISLECRYYVTAQYLSWDVTSAYVQIQGLYYSITILCVSHLSHTYYMPKL